MTTYVLVHGGWHGGWCWADVAAGLRAAGHAVSAPTLAGLGERAAELAPDIGLERHVQDVADVLAAGELRDVVLVGHSYGGMVVTGVAERAADRLAHLVYLDAFVPEDGQALFDILRPERRAYYEQLAESEGDGWRVPPPPPQALGIADEGQAARLAARLTPQPLRTFVQPVRLGASAGSIPRTYIHCTEGPLAPSFAPFAARARTAPGWRLRELATGHDAMLTAANALVALLLELAGPDAARPATSPEEPAPRSPHARTEEPRP
jgi:pimeloyl-ACP methyl ester carboxylesterase